MLLLAVAVPVVLWVRYSGRPLRVTYDSHDPECNQWSPSRDQADWQQVRLKVSSRWGAPVKKVQLSLTHCSDPQVNTGQSAYMHLTHDNHPDRLLQQVGESARWNRPVLFDVAIHRPGKASVLEYSDQALRNMGYIPTDLYPCFISLGFTVNAQRFKGDKEVRFTEKSYVLEVHKGGQLELHDGDAIAPNAILTLRPPEPPGFAANLSPDIAPPSGAAGPTGMGFVPPLGRGGAPSAGYDGSD